MMRSANRLRMSAVVALVAALAASTLATGCVHLFFGGRATPPVYIAASGLRAYLGAQGTFQRLDRYGKGDLRYANPIDGTGFPDLFRIGGPLAEADGTELKLIDLVFARANSPETPKCGYWFIDIVADKVSGPYDFTKECGLCAVPFIYGETGIHTLVVDLTGTVYRKDNGGVPVTVYPDVAKDGWKPVSM